MVSKSIKLQGVYTYDPDVPSIQVDTFCVHGGPDGYITGIRGKVQCLSEEDKVMKETDLENQEMIREKCYLKFPTLPFIPKEPYDVIATDYENFALVSGAKDKSFVQIYSRNPVPGNEFIEKYKSYLENIGYDSSKIKDTPQDCEVMSDSRLAAMMSMYGMEQALTNRFPTLELNSAVQFNPFTSVFDTLKKLVQLYFK
ncbi:Chloroplastic lipocalin like [Thalictrum thalictroides]|uniref:Chloroplastic lipocalin like n=1 Tax=Thalictrum thalictroides TaxID=46969 RepID=A0A7J6WJE6_THATH|nr:Chloroplastic lipocalin like [Thalictrum thalictroides]